MQRRLAAILAADVVGYSRLMGEDETGTLERLKTCRQQSIDPILEQFHGRIVKLMGDGALVEFASVVDAVQCAAAIQRAMASYEPDIDEARRIRFRIGVNLGDVIVEGDDLYGDGVNIAARVQALAEPGGICISGAAFDHARHKVDVGFESLGELRLKNIAEPVRAYRVALDPRAAGKVIAAPRKTGVRAVLMGLAGLLLIVGIAAVLLWRGSTTPARPSIAVLPFANLSGDPREEHLADGITVDVITDLAKLSAIDVISFNSVASYKDRPAAVKDVARDLGVGFVMEGSMRRAGDKIRITATLIDAATGDHLWAEKYERGAGDVFAIADEIVGHIAGATGMKPSAVETEMVTRPPTANLEAYDYYLRGEQAARSGSRPLLRKALEFYAKAEALDPAFAEAFAADARTAVFAWRNVYDDVLPIPVAKKRAYEMAGRALDLDPRSSQPYATLAVLQAVDKQYDQAIASARKAVGLGPSNVDAHIALGFVLSVAGRHAEAAAAIGSAQRLDPNLSATDRQVAGLVFLLHGNLGGAIETLEKARAQTPGVDDVHTLLAAAYATAGRMDEARVAAAEALRLGAYSIESYRMSLSYLRNSTDLETILGALSKAGFHQWPSGFQGDERDRLSGEDVSRLVLGHTLRGKINAVAPAIMQIDKDGNTVFRSAALLYTGRTFVDRDRLCVQSEGLGLGRADCGPVYRRPAGEELAYAYVNGSFAFYFSPIE
jgi:TolB-like protein/class 3 adenylate cyclase